MREMKIASIELFQVPPRWLFLKLTTDDGLIGHHWKNPIWRNADGTIAEW